MRRFIVLVVLVTILPSFGQAKTKQSGRNRSNRTNRPSVVKPGSNLVVSPLSTVTFADLAKRWALHQNITGVSLAPVVQPYPTPTASPLDIKAPRLKVAPNRTFEFATSVDPKVVAGLGGAGYVFAGLTEEELTKRLIQFNVHPKRVPGLIKSIKKPGTKGAMFAIAVTGATAYVYQQYKEYDQQVANKSTQTSAQQQPGKEEVKAQPETTIQSPAQDDQPRGYNIYTVGVIFGLVAFSAFFILHKKEYVQ